MSSDEGSVEIIARLTPAILRALHALEFTSRHISPATLRELIAAVGKRDDDLGPALEASRAAAWPERLGPVRVCLERSGEAAAEGIAAFLVAEEAPQPMLAAYRALRGYARAAEALYPLAANLKPVSQFFLESSARDDSALVAKLAAADPSAAGVGSLHVGGPAGTRGAFSLYVPEYYDPARPWPLVVALHGGSGNGGAFLWSWVPEARTRGFVRVPPAPQTPPWA